MIILHPRSECVVPVQCAAPGLRFLQARLRDNATGVHKANRVAEILPNQPFTVRVVNTSTETRRLPKRMVLGMLQKHRSMWNGRLGQVHSTAHRIDLIPGQKPVHCQPYRAGPKSRALESAEIQRMLKAEVIEPATSEWASPIVLVAKPEGSTRFLRGLSTAQWRHRPGFIPAPAHG
jgi:hypothetical protein